MFGIWIYISLDLGTGKTEVGKALAKRLSRKFVDLDDLIEIKEDMKITDIFSKKGPIAKLLPEYELRPQQQKMAEENFYLLIP